jgi:calmodulin
MKQGSMAVRLSNEKMTELREAFMLFDYSKSGRIFARDIGPVIRSVGLKPSEAEIQSIMAEVQQMGGEVDLSALVQLIHLKVTNPPIEKPEDLREIFRLYDKEGRGLVSVAEMRHLLTSVGEKLTDDEADQLLRMSGCVQGGMVQYDKFVQVILRG